MKGKKGDDIIQMTTTWPSTISDKMIFLRSEWSISSQYDAGRNVVNRPFYSYGWFRGVNGFMVS